MLLLRKQNALPALLIFTFFKTKHLQKILLIFGLLLRKQKEGKMFENAAGGRNARSR